MSFPSSIGYWDLQGYDRQNWSHTENRKIIIQGILSTLFSTQYVALWSLDGHNVIFFFF